jgi:hypothetical protein
MFMPIQDKHRLVDGEFTFVCMFWIWLKPARGECTEN